MLSYPELSEVLALYAVFVLTMYLCRINTENRELLREDIALQMKRQTAPILMPNYKRNKFIRIREAEFEV